MSPVHVLKWGLTCVCTRTVHGLRPPTGAAVRFVLPEPTPLGGLWSGFLPQGVPAVLGLGTKLLSSSHEWEAGTSPVTRKGPYQQHPVTVSSQDNRAQAQAGGGSPGGVGRTQEVVAKGAGIARTSLCPEQGPTASAWCPSPGVPSSRCFHRDLGSLGLSEVCGLCRDRGLVGRGPHSVRSPHRHHFQSTTLLPVSSVTLSPGPAQPRHQQVPA